MKTSKLLQETLAIQLVLFAIIAIMTSLVSSWNLRQNLLAEYISKGIAITKSVANFSRQLPVPDEYFQQIIEQFHDISGVGYIFVHDEKQRIIAHTFFSTVPEEILIVGKEELPIQFEKKEIKIKELYLETLGNVTDISYPISDNRQVHVGMGHDTIEKRINFAILIQVVIVTLLFVFTIALAYFLIGRISEDLNQLIAGTEQVRARQFNTVIKIKSKHEIGVLADTFNAMVIEIRNYAHNLQQSEERFRIITETISIPLIIVDECEGFILYANTLTSNTLKISISELMSHKLIDFFADPAEWEKILEIFAINRSVNNYETQFISNEYKVLCVTLSLQLIILNNEQGILIAIHDISDRKRAESFGSIARQLEEKVIERTRELRDKHDVLINLNQEKNEFLGIVAHDLKNPLSAILGMSEDIETAYDEMEREEVIELAGKIQTSSRQMFELITNLLDVNAIESGKMNLTLKILDILPIVEFLVIHYTEIAKLKNITLHFFHTQEKYIAFTDPNIVRQTLDNVISNAIKYSFANSNVFIYLVETEKVIRCSVQDEGPGLSFADQQKLFSKFTRLTPRPTGKEHSTGLGLFIVKKLIDAVNGHVHCESKQGKGSTFIIEFPSATAVEKVEKK